MVWLLCTCFMIVSIFLYCLGGQTAVWTRRFLLPPLQALLTLALTFSLNLVTWIALVPLLWIPTWTEGDSDHGWLRWLRRPWLICAVYGLVASIPVLAGIVVLHRNWWLLGAIPAISGLFVPDLPSTKLFTTKGGHEIAILWRDVLRISVVSVCWLGVLLWK